MADFAELNAVYAEYFDYTNPPARVTVAVGDFLPPTVNVMLSIVAHKDVERNGLHVQSQSYWAPANIGPYSQAVTVPILSLHDLKVDPSASREVHIAGQIPLRPSSMELYTDGGFKGQALLSLQHLWRVGRATGVRWWPAGVAYLPYSGDRKEQETRIMYVQALWKAIHAHYDANNEADDEAEEVDAWDRKNLHATFDDRNPPPRLVRPAGTASGGCPPCYVVEVDTLPRNASIEWSCTGLTGGSQPGVYHSMRSAELQMGTSVFQYMQHWVHGTVYLADTDTVKLPSGDWAFRGVQWVPCKHVWGWKGEEVGAVIVGRPASLG
jgi:diphthine-ammonia ligase